ncbi:MULTISPECIES: VIT domain-containing protein [Spirulina sp. CCY15215]|uniref:VIT domain-containing protein n=1 Tax=Spirulina sp. CCY15215 TaxID=2767591 RepID=UPI001950329E|nr:VIT domain-containing protein [Spirulina major]
MNATLFLSLTLFLVGLGGTTSVAIAQTPSRSAPNSLPTDSMRNAAPSAPTSGLFVLSEEGEPRVFPLKHTEVKAKVSGNVSRVEVTQTFENPFSDPLEAVYVFPLPDEAAVDDMEIKIGDRIIKGDIKKREEAREIYEQARREGRTAGLLEQERANIFTQSLANIKPGEKIDVTIRYTDSLTFEGGDYEFVFPMVVGPRYIPGTPINLPIRAPDPTRENWGQDSDRVPDASRITPPVLPPGTRSGHDIGVTVELDAGGLVQNVRSPSHKIITNNRGDIVEVKLNPEDNIPNKDLILRYRVSGKETQATVLTQADEKGGHFALYLVPAIEYKTNEIVPKDVVFLMDTSGSQAGEPIAKSKELMRRFINGLNPNDTFTVIDFANTAQALSPTPLANTKRNRDRALDYVEALEGNGGTELLNGINAVLNYPSAPAGRLRSIVLLTDGYIGNDNEIIARVRDELKYGNRLYSFGVGSSVNRFLLDRLAEVGRGTMQVIRQDEPSQETVEKFFQHINNPVLTNISVSWEGGGDSPDIYPQFLPDLFANQPLVLFGRKGDRTNGKLRVTGVAAGGRRYDKTIAVNFNNEGNLAIAQLWGRSQIKEIMSQMIGGETISGVEAITNTALTYRLLSQYTAFVAVSEEIRVDPDGTRRRVDVPVELPEGVSFEGIFGDSGEKLNDTYGGFTSRGTPASAVPPPSVSAPSGRTLGGVNRPSPSPQYRQNRRDREQNQPVDPALIIDGTPSQQPQETEEQAIVLSLEVIEANGFDRATIDALNQYLHNISIPNGVRGELIFELRLRNGRIELAILDDVASTVTEKTLINEIRRRLLTWSPPQGISGTYAIKLRVR